MRIIAGKFRQRKLLRPDEEITRPTTDKIRQAIFNILGHGFDIDFSSLTVLDAFAGSGAMGLEAISRGACHAFFVEKNPKSVQVLRRNILTLQAQEHTTILQNDILKLKPASHPVGLIFLDPPYGKGFVIPVCEHLYKQQWIGQETLVCVESSTQDTPQELPHLRKLDERLYGNTAVSFWKILKDAPLS